MPNQRIEFAATTFDFRSNAIRVKPETGRLPGQRSHCRYSGALNQGALMSALATHSRRNTLAKHPIWIRAFALKERVRRGPGVDSQDQDLKK